MTSTLVGRRPRARLLLLSLSTVLCSGLAAPAFADSPYRNLDGNGVDLTDGSFNLNLLEGSIGAGPGQLSLVRLNASTTNWSSPRLDTTVSGSTYTVTVSMGATYDNFSGTITGGSGTLASSRATGATLTVSGGVVTTYNFHDGSTISFGSPVESQGGASNLCDGNVITNCSELALSADGKSGMTVSYNYDVHANCASSFNPDGTLDCTYAWRLASIANDAGYAINWTFTSNSATNPHANPSSAWFQIASAYFTNANVSASSWPTVTYAYPSSGVITITTPGGKTWRIANDTNGRVTALRRPSASSDTTTVSYGTNGVSSVTSNGITTGYSRTVSGATATMVVTDAQSHSATIVSDMTKYRPTSVTDPLSRVTTMSYDGVGRPTEMVAPEGNKVQYAYDGRGNLTTTTRVAKSGSGLSNIVTSATYASSCTDASCNEPTTTTDALGNVTDYTYDGTTGQVLTVTAPAPVTSATRPVTTYSYSSVSGVSMLTGVSRCQTGSSCVGTSDEVRTTASYNSNLLPTSTSTGAGDGSLTATTAVTYDAIGNLLTVDGPLSGTADTTTLRWSADRERVGVISPDPDGSGAMKRRAVKTSYNSDGQISATEVGTVAGTSDSDWSAFVSLQQSTPTYDGNDRKTLDTMAASATTYTVKQYSYDALGRLECTALRMNNATWGSLPSSACSLGTSGSYGPDRITKRVYDAAGQVTKVQTAYGVTGVQADEATGTYNGNGTLATLTDAEGNKTSYVYDGFDRLSQTFYPSTTAGAGTSSTTDYTQITYDAGSEVTARRLRDGTSIGYSYDHLGRLTYKDLPTGEYDATYGYDLLGRPVSAATNLQTLTFGYDALSRMTSQGGPFGTVAMQYDLAGRRTRLTWPDSFYASYDYLVTGEVSAVRENGATSGTGVLASYAYDDLGRRTSLTRGNGTSTIYGFDNASRLSSLGLDLDGAATTNDFNVGFSYSPAGQIAATTRSNNAYAWGGAANRNDASSVNGLNQVTAVGAGSIGYDSKGNLNSTGSNSYTYSSENLLLTGPSSTSLAYDPLLRLYQESGSSVATRLFQYDGQAMIGEYDTSSALQRRYVHGPGADEPLVEYDKSGGSYTRVWLHTDQNGSVIAQSNDSGATTAVNSYDEYGVPASGNTGRFQYTGQMWLPSLGLYYYKARLYSARLGRFMQTDPIGYGSGMNSYNYVSSDPIGNNDPSGMVCTQTNIGWYEWWYEGEGGKYWNSHQIVPGSTFLVPGDCGASVFSGSGLVGAPPGGRPGNGAPGSDGTIDCSPQAIVAREGLEKLSKAFETASNIAFGAALLGGGGSAALGVFGIVTLDPAAAYFGGQGVELATQLFGASTVLGLIGASLDAAAGHSAGLGRAEISAIVTIALSKAGLKNEYVKAFIDKLVDKALKQSGLADPECKEK